MLVCMQVHTVFVIESLGEFCNAVTFYMHKVVVQVYFFPVERVLKIFLGLLIMARNYIYVRKYIAIPMFEYNFECRKLLEPQSYYMFM